MLKIIFSFTLTILCLSIQAQSSLRIVSPASIAGDYPVARALFGNGFADTLRGELIIANNGSGNARACDTIVNNIQGKIVLIDRGDCFFDQKALRAQRLGAKAMIIINNAAGGISVFGITDPAITIPSVMISLANGNLIKAAGAGTQGFLYFNDPTGTEPVLYSETFNGGKGAWTSVGISAAKDTFTWDPKGISRGALGEYVIDAPTANNGTMIFDADYLTTQGDTLKIPAGSPPYPNHHGELISPIINCSSFNSVTLKFFELYRGLNGSTFISYSTNGGTTWATPIEVNADLPAGDITEGGKFLKIELPALANQAQARIKFIFNGDFYAWIIDDVKLLGKAPFDIAVQPDQFFFPFSFATPASQITTDTSTFSGDLANFGTTAAVNLKMKVQVTNSLGAFLHRDSLIVASLAPGAKDTTFFFPKSYIPGKMDPGVYTITYSVEGGPGSPADADPTNNSQKQDFIVTDNLYSKDDGQNINSGVRAPNDGDYFIGNLYNTSTDWKAADKFSASEITFGAFMDRSDGMLKGKSVTIYLAELLPTIAPDFNNFDLNKSITENPAQIKIVGIGTYDFKEDQAEVATVAIQEIVNFTDKVPLKKGTRYLVGVSYKDASNKAYNYVETDIDYYYISSLLFGAGQWGGSFAPVARLRLDISTAVDELALPDYTLQLSPNPATDLIRAQVNFDKKTDANFIIADINGRVLEFKSQKGILKESFDFNVRSYAPGTYLMRISTDEGTKTKKFIIQR